jgi:hypothetical protein
MFETDDGPGNTVRRISIGDQFLVSDFFCLGTRGARGTKGGRCLQSDHLLHDRLDPGLEKGVLGCLAVDGEGCYVGLSQIGLVEHERIVVEAEQVARVGGLFDREKRIEVAGSCRRCDPLGDRTGWQIALRE